MSTTAIINQLKANGERLTKTRIEIVNLLGATAKPLSVPELVKKISSHPHKTTVYRELAFLLDNNIVEEIIFNDGIKRYETPSRHHHHLVCTKCKKVTKLSAEKICRLAAGLVKKTGYLINSHSFEFFGLCPECQKK